MDLHDAVIAYRGREEQKIQAQDRQATRTPGYYAGLEAGRAQAGRSTKKGIGFSIGKQQAMSAARKDQQQKKLQALKQRQVSLRKKQNELRIKSNDIKTGVKSAVSKIVAGTSDVCDLIDELIA